MMKKLKINYPIVNDVVIEEIAYTLNNSIALYYAVIKFEDYYIMNSSNVYVDMAKHPLAIRNRVIKDIILKMETQPTKGVSISGTQEQIYLKFEELSK